MLIPLMEIIMELLPNSKCLTKIKNHLQLGLIRELIGLLPVGKQWGYNSTTFAISFSNACWLVIPAFNGSGDNYYGFNITGKSTTNFTYNRHGGITGTISYIAAGK